MLNLMFLFILLISCRCVPLDERFKLDNPFELDNPFDLVVETEYGPLEAYKSTMSIANVLRWMALGRARLVKKDNSSISHYFRFENDGFYGYLNLSLTNKDRELLAAEARKNHSSGSNIQSSQILDGHTGDVNFLVLLRNGHLASASDDKTIKVWNVQGDGSLVRTLTGHLSHVWSLVVLRNGHWASSSYDQTIKIWNVEGDGRLIRTLTGHIYPATSLALLKNGFLASSDARRSTFGMPKVTVN
jgi:WD40 repeat protein